MAHQQHYSQAPISEAIIDIRVQFPEPADLTLLQKTGESEQVRYPREERVFEVVGTLKAELGVSTSSSSQQRQIGYKRTSADRKYVWQNRISGFTLSRLAPYENWDTFRAEARRLWDFYRGTVQPPTIKRLAVRYVNRINIPGVEIEFRDYFRTFPEISSDLPRQLSGFFLQVQGKLDDISGDLVINQTVVPPPQPGMISVILDVEIYRTEHVPQQEADIWEYFELLHTRKNGVFEACITDKCRELFSPCPS